MGTEEQQQWVVDMRNRIEGTDISAETEQQYWSKHSIYRVPSHIKDLNRKAYKPQVVSFGPFHRGEPHLRPMEEHKQRALVHFVKRAQASFDDLAAAVYAVAQTLQDAYHELDGEFRDKGRFVELMIVDGCFMLEVIRVTDADRSSDYAPNDPIFSWHGVLPIIRRDMLMIENQLPLLLLETLFAFQIGKPPYEGQINRLVLKFLLPEPRLLPARLGLGLGLHPLDVCRKSMVVQSPPRDLRRWTFCRPACEIIRSAVELYEAGIRFKKSKTDILRDIQFSHGVLSLPVVVVDDSTEYMFLNLMAFERLHFGAGTEVTSYVVFMDCLIDSAKDVSLLISQGIIRWAGVGGDEAAAKLFNSLSKDVAVDPDNSLNIVHLMVSDYCRKPCNKWRANLIHTYFRSPWAFLSLLAAILLLVLTITQTVYTVMSYYQSKSSQPSPPPPP